VCVRAASSPAVDPRRLPSITGPVAKAAGPLVFRERRRETSAAFSLSGPRFARVVTPGRVSPARVVITSRAARERLEAPVVAKVSLSLPETPAGVMRGSAPL